MKFIVNLMSDLPAQIIGYDPFVTAEDCATFHAAKMELDEIWPLADYITLHTPLIESTKSTYIHVFL